MTIGYAGAHGSFSEQAAMKYRRTHSNDSMLIPCLDSQGVITFLQKARIDCGVVPVLNSIGGEVVMTKEALRGIQDRFTVLGTIALPIAHCVMAIRGVAIEDITELRAHEQVFRQCRQSIAHDTYLRFLPQVPVRDTAESAAELVAGKLSRTVALIGPKSAADVHGLSVLQENMQDTNDNITTFHVLSLKK